MEYNANNMNNNDSQNNSNNNNINNNEDNFKPLTPIQVKIFTFILSILLLGQSVIRFLHVKDLKLSSLFILLLFELFCESLLFILLTLYSILKKN